METAVRAVNYAVNLKNVTRGEEAADTRRKSPAMQSQVQEMNSFNYISDYMG